MPFWNPPPACKPVIGMCHLGPLPGSPGFGGRITDVREALLRDAEALVTGGVAALMIENFGDAPFYPARVPAIVVAHLAALASDVRRRFDVPLGVNVLRNDGCSALAVAHASGCAFIRVNVLSGARVTDQGVVQAIAHDLLRERSALRAEDIRIFADVDVKESTPLGAPLPLEDEIDDLLRRGLADAVILSGANTGSPAAADHVRRAHAAVRRGLAPAEQPRPVLVGSGMTPTNLPSLWPHADGFIVGSFFKQQGQARGAVDPQRVREFVEACRRIAGA